MRAGYLATPDEGDAVAEDVLVGLRRALAVHELDERATHGRRRRPGRRP